MCAFLMLYLTLFNNIFIIFKAFQWRVPLVSVLAEGLSSLDEIE